MKAVICCVAIGSWYPRGLARLVNEFHATDNGHTIQAWVNTIPPGAPHMALVDDYDYVGYCAKPFALAHAMQQADVAILMDAAFFPIRSIHPLIAHIVARGHYLCDNGNLVGEWSSDAALDYFGMMREEAMGVREASSYCVGLSNVGLGHRDRNRLLVKQWCDSWRSFPGPHTAGDRGRNPGFVSHDPRVKGHRHDQTALSIIAHRLGMTELTQRPEFTAYDGSQDERTVLVNRGGL